jgi:hypothetical protein
MFQTRTDLQFRTSTMNSYYAMLNNSVNEETQHIVKTPYGKGSVIHIRHNTKDPTSLPVQEIRLIDWEAAMKVTDANTITNMTTGVEIQLEEPKLAMLYTTEQYPRLDEEDEPTSGPVSPLSLRSIADFIETACGANLAFEGALGAFGQRGGGRKSKPGSPHSLASQSAEETAQIRADMEDLFKYTPMFALTLDDLKINYRGQLGEGGFCNVFPVHIRNGKSGQFNENLPPFALKQLRGEITDDPNLFKMACADIKQEAKIMKSLEHENVIKMFGMSGSNVPPERFFVVIEKLEGTLHSKLQKWAKILGPFKKNTPKDTVRIRLKEVALPIAEGMEYLHSQKVVYRDLKPGNVGFDKSGRVKLFDFGLAEFLLTNDKTLKGKCGTPRYMPPEMRQNKPYSFPIDVYIYTIMLWQIITSRVPFEKEIPTMDMFAPTDIPQDKRPNMKYIEFKPLAAFLEACWKTDPNERLTFHQIVPHLIKIMREMVSKNDKKRLSSMNNY